MAAAVIVSLYIRVGYYYTICDNGKLERYLRFIIEFSLSTYLHLYAEHTTLH